VAYDFCVEILSLIKVQRVSTVGLVLGALFFSACGSSGEGDTTSARRASATSPPAQVPPAQPKNLAIKDLVKGKGTAIPPISHKPRVEITVLSRAVEYGTGKPYGEWQYPYDPLKVEFGPGLNEGLAKGLVGMRVGGRRELTVPSRMTFDNVPVIYVIHLLHVKKRGVALYARERKQGLVMSKAEIAKLPKLTIAKQSGPPPKHIKITDLREGSGATLKKHDTVYVRFFQAMYPEVQRRSRTGRNGPSSFGLDGTVKGWRVGLPGMKVGGRRELILPPKLVYPRWKPSWGYAPYVRIYMIDLIGLKPPAEPAGEG